MTSRSRTRLLLSVLASLGGLALAAGSQSPTPQKATGEPRVQSAADPEVITIDNGKYYVQRASSGELRLGPNECFFDGPGLSLRGTGNKNQAAPELNGNKSFRRIGGFSTKNSALWFLSIQSTGTATLHCSSTTSTSLLWTCNKQTGTLEGTSFIRFEQPGIYRLRVHKNKKKKKKKKKNTGATVEALTLRGTAVHNAGVLRTRWRPTAAHTRFTATEAPSACKLWIMEMDGVPGDASFYAPMTTPFGYFGSSWTREGRPTGLNFSMWSYRRGAEEPPIEQLSHLIAIGNPEASFGHFGHEGTGVKVRDWNPFANWQGQRAVYALRWVPGSPYDTYYGYYFAEETSTWQLFAAGKKFRKDKPRTRARRRRQNKLPDRLTVGSFVEVPGPPQRQRTGHIVRSMRYRGFMRDSSGRWYPIDHMKGEGKPGALHNRDRRETDDRRFIMSMGGMRQQGPNSAVHLQNPTAKSDLPWMQADALKALLTVPTELRTTHLAYADGVASIQLEVRGLAENAHATIYFGADEGLTIAKRWAHRHEVKALVEGKQTIRWPANRAPRRARILLRDSQGQFWSDATATRQH